MIMMQSVVRPSRSQYVESMRLRIPYTDALPAPCTRPSLASTFDGAVLALQNFLLAPDRYGRPRSTTILTGAGLSVSSGLADYRGNNGTYRLQNSYRPIYHHEFLSSHEARKRYWARSFFGWATLHQAAPNKGHFAIGDLARMRLVHNVITQNVDSFHSRAHPHLPTLELHGYLRSVICTTCLLEFPRDAFQEQLARLNTSWASLLIELMASGALQTNGPNVGHQRVIRTNPDGDLELPDAPYTKFRYPPCPQCLANPPLHPDGTRHTVQTDSDGAWAHPSTAAVFKPAVVMFGESIRHGVKDAAEAIIDNSTHLLVLATSLATYSAWRLVKKAKDLNVKIAIVNAGGVRGESELFANLESDQNGEDGVRCEISTDLLLPVLVQALQSRLETENAFPETHTTIPRKALTTSEVLSHDAYRDTASIGASMGDITSSSVQ